MMYQTILIVALVGATVVLALLLIFRIRRERYEMAAVRQLSLTEFSDLLKTNSKDGVIGQVAGQVSGLLTRSFGCELIIFLRKKRGVFKYNFSYGLEQFNRNEFRMAFSRELAEKLESEYLPRPVSDLKGTITDSFYESLQATGVDTFFPIFWRNNIYGLYFIRSTLKTGEPAFNLLIASLAQALSAAYHIKWHETRNDDLQRRLQQQVEKTDQLHDHSEKPNNVLKLVRHRNTETIVPRIVETMKADLGLERVAYFYQQDQSGGNGPQLAGDGLKKTPELPPQQEFKKIAAMLKGGSAQTLESLESDPGRKSSWLSNLRKSGFRYVAAYSMAPGRNGVLAWSGGGRVQAINQRLGYWQAQAADLIDNAEDYEKVEQMSYTDNLTGLANQRYLFRRLDEEIARAKRYRRKLGLIMFDLDGLKATNDTYGHLAGDAGLSRLGEILRGSIRSIDIVARYGGDEFCVIMPEADKETCVRFMQRLQRDIAGEKFPIDGLEKPLTCTVSLGGAIFPDHAGEGKELLHTADMALLRAKDTGRNQALLHGGDA